jgi:hypothetical protein
MSVAADNFRAVRALRPPAAPVRYLGGNACEVSEVGESSFQSAITAILRPLEFAARDDFSKLDRVRDLEQTVSAAAGRAAGLAIPPDAERELTRIAKLFSAAAEGELAARVREAIEALRPLAELTWSERQLANSTATLPGVRSRICSSTFPCATTTVAACSRLGASTWELARPSWRACSVARSLRGVGVFADASSRRSSVTRPEPSR